MDKLDKAVINTLIYFDIFSFPLDLEELHRFCPIEASPADIVRSVKRLCAQNTIVHNCCFFAIAKRNNCIVSRVNRYKLSKMKMPIAVKNARLISRFPFVRGVSISGSLSKYAADEKADIDFFIITAPKRLWLCRSFLHLFKKLTYLTGHQHDFCMNYFLALNELELKDKNLYTAIESTTIIPVFQPDMYDQFLQKNEWISHFLPNQKGWFRNLSPLTPSGQFLKKWIERLWAGQWGNWCDALLQKITIRWWRRKFRRQGFPMEYFEKDLRATSGESKYHPFDYQRKILNVYRSKIESMGSLNPISKVRL